MKKMNMKIESLELRSCDDHLCLSGEHTTYEIILWFDSTAMEKSCYTIAYWKSDNDGYYLKFVGNRPFDKNIDIEDFWELAKLGQSYLDKIERGE